MQNKSASLLEQDFTSLYRELAPKVLNYLIRLGEDRDGAEEILQETFYSVLAKMASFQGRSSPATWVYKIATNKFIDRRRKAWNKVYTDSRLVEVTPSNAPSPERQCLLSEEARKLQEALYGLPPDQKTALILVRFEGMKYREAAEVLEVRLSTVRMRVYKGLLAIKRSLGEPY